jgi:hypothetical protein
MNFNKNNENLHATTLEQLVANACFCKLRGFCNDKESNQCMQHRNLYQEFMEKELEQHLR